MSEGCGGNGNECNVTYVAMSWEQQSHFTAPPKHFTLPVALAPISVRCVIRGLWEAYVRSVAGGMGCCCSKEDRSYTKVTTRRRREESEVAGYDEASGRRSEKSTGPKPPYVALWDYVKTGDAELSFFKGDLFTEVGDSCDALSNFTFTFWIGLGLGLVRGPEWVFVTRTSDEKKGDTRKSSGGTTGYIPRNYVASLGTVETEPFWYGDITRADADAMLRNQPPGTFVIRGRLDAKPQLALSVAYECRVRHYRIYSREDNRRTLNFYIGSTMFTNLADLVSHFRQSAEGGICCVLTEPPPRAPPPPVAISADVEKRWREIPRNQIQLLNEIGKGYYGVVFRGSYEPLPGTKLEVAVKELKRGVAGSQAGFITEAVAMKNLRHHNLVRLVGIVSADEPFYIVTEFMKEGSLRTFLKRRAKENRLVPEEQLVDISRQVADGMHYLERKNTIHRDLAARNVLIREANRASSRRGKSSLYDVKIADFGLAQMMKGSAMKEQQSINLPTKWTAPEALTRGTFSIASDVWSFGILLYEIFTHGREPYEGMTTEQTRTFVLEEKRILMRPREMPEKIHVLLAGCCDYEPNGRPTFEAILGFLTNYYEKEGAYECYITADKRKKNKGKQR